jgi:hypothetical protein
MRTLWPGFQLLFLYVCLLNATLLAADPTHPSKYETEWDSANGVWMDTSKWSAGAPNAFEEAVVGGSSNVVIPSGAFVAGVLEIGNRPGDHAIVELDGGQLLIRQDSLRIGEYTGGEGTFILNDGAMHSVMDVFVGGVTGTTHRMNKSALIIQGGSFVGLTLTVGEGLGSQSLVAIKGSRAKAIEALEFVSLHAEADPGGKPAESTLSFTLDEHGVTPITILSRWRGLTIEDDESSHCRLQIALSAVPPRENVPLVVAHVPIEGTFDDLPEGAQIEADFAGHTYRWNLTYHGGIGGHDLMLINHSTYEANAPTTHVRPVPEPVTPLWQDHPLYPLSIPAGTPAFAGAEGYGAFTPGGRGGRVDYVANLDDSGPGSLRAAAEADGPRLAVFRVGGVIALKSPIVIQHPYLTIDGAAAPGPGIMLQRHGIEVHTHDVVLRQFRIRIGDQDVRTGVRNIRYAAGDGEYALYFTEASWNCIADHLSLSWSTNKILSTTKMSDLITIQWCILSESLNLDGHGYASITGGNRVTWHHNLFAHNFSRNVRFQGAVDADFRNNVIYDWGEKSAYGEFDRLNYVGNYLKPGPSTTQRPLLFHDGFEFVTPGSLFLAGNIIAGNPKATADNWKGTAFFFDRKTLAASNPFPAPAISIEPAAIAYEHVLAQAGAILPLRDAVDQRIVREVRAGSGQIIQSVAEAGGWPPFLSTRASVSPAAGDGKSN